MRRRFGLAVALSLAAGTTHAGPPAFQVCAACHGAAGEGGEAGPAIRGIIGHAAGADPDFAYSAALKRSGRIWTEANLAAFLLDPQVAVPGTRMAYPGAGSPAAAAALAAAVAALR